MINVEVHRHGNENIGGLMRRYTRKMQSSGIVRHVRGMRYFKRASSTAQVKKDALIRLKRTGAYRKLYKEGREIPSKRRR